MNNESPSHKATTQSKRSGSSVPLGNLFFENLIEQAQQNRGIVWEPFHAGVERFWIYQTGNDGPAAALLRFDPGGSVPLHEHTGYEHIYILSGSQEDEHGEAKAGALIISPPGSRHSIVSKTGCLVLAVYERPVKFV
jgi:anti-sigma factor ChrR (cupin superfamily)